MTTQQGSGRLSDRTAIVTGAGQGIGRGIARAFAKEPRILFADEPTGNLARETGEAIANLLFELNRERGTTLVIVTHDLELAERAGRVVHISAGCIDRIEVRDGAAGADAGSAGSEVA